MPLLIINPRDRTIGDTLRGSIDSFETTVELVGAISAIMYGEEWTVVVVDGTTTVHIKATYIAMLRSFGYVCDIVLSSGNVVRIDMKEQKVSVW